MMRPGGTVVTRYARSVLSATTRIARVAFAVVAVALASALAQTTPAGGQPTDDSASCRADRLLIVSIPDLSWRTLRSLDPPAMMNFLDDAAVASLAPARTVPHDAGPADTYLTFGAGARTVGDPPSDGEVMQRDEVIDGVTVAELVQRRFDAAIDAPIVALGWPRIERVNDDLPYESRPGELAAQLDANDIERAVIANADGSDTASEALHREAALALVGPRGTLEHGAVDISLLVDDPFAPFGVRLDAAVVLDRFDEVWTDEPTVVLVEASDITRAQRYRTLSTSDQRSVASAQAMRRSDDLFAGLLQRVDASRDAVMLIAPPDGVGTRDLTVLGVRSPCGKRGWLRSASTQKQGVVSTIDLAPGILAEFGIAYTDKMEGRPFEYHSSGASLEDRMRHMIADSRGSAFRAQQLFPATVVFVVILAIIALASVLLFVEPTRSQRATGIVTWGAACAMAAFPAALWVQQLPGSARSAAAYYGWLASVAIAVGSAVVAARRNAIHRVGILLALALGTILLDAMSGSRLHYNAVFGYSPTSNSRLYGISNYSFGAVVATSLLLAAGLAHFVPRRGQLLALLLLGFVLVVEGVPVWGSDVGGVLAGVPTFLVFALLVSRRKVRWRAAALAMGATAAAIAGFAAIDLARPAEERAHLGRLVERVQRDGVGPLFAIVGRKLEAALRESTKSFWVTAIPIAIIVLVVVTRLGAQPLRALRARIPSLHSALVAAFVGVGLGSALNDSGAIVGGTLSYMLSLTLIVVCLAETPAATGP